MRFHNYYVYITTNVQRTVLYTGVTNDLKRRLYEHGPVSKGDSKHFTDKYKAYYLLYWECFVNIGAAISREKQIKGWTRKKKEELIEEFNPRFEFLNNQV